MDHNVIGNFERDGLKTLGIGQSATKSSKIYYVYRLTNSVNGKAYIGITGRTIGVRWSEHLERARQGVRNSRLYSAIRKYGSSVFVREVLACCCSEENARETETVLINQHNTFENGYNANLGGEGFLEFPEHIRRKISAAQKGKIIPEVVRRKISAAKLGNSKCAVNFGIHTNKGSQNPRSRFYRFRCPDGEEIVTRGLRAFCREHGLHLAHINARGHSKGFVLLERLNDYGESQYGQAAGKSGRSARSENIVFSASKDVAVA